MTTVYTFKEDQPSALRVESRGEHGHVVVREANYKREDINIVCLFLARSLTNYSVFPVVEG